MEVYFDTNFWGSRKRIGMPMRQIPCNLDFDWEGAKGRIFAVYVNAQGVAVDVGTCVELSAIRDYIEKYQDCEEEPPAGSNPFESDYQLRLSVNGVELEQGQSCGTYWYPPELHGNETREVGVSGKQSIEDELMETYSCSRDFGWYFLSFSVRLE